MPKALALLVVLLGSNVVLPGDYSPGAWFNTSAPARVITYDPYANVDWSGDTRCLTQVHDHYTTGNTAPSESRITAADDAGYCAIPVMAYSGDPAVTYDWDQEYGPSDLDSGFVAGLTNIQLLLNGVEQIGTQHTTSLFATGYREFGVDYATPQGVVDAIAADGGLPIIAHPYEGSPNYPERVWATEVCSSVADWNASYRDPAERQPALPGNLISYWNTVLDAGRRVFGVCVADQWGPYRTPDTDLGNAPWELPATHIDGGKIEVLVPTVNESNLKSRMQTGAILAIHDLGATKGNYPNITRIDVSRTTITVVATGYTSITWVTNGGRTASTSATVDLESDLLATDEWVRAVLENADTSRVYTQPWWTKIRPVQPTEETAAAETPQCNDGLDNDGDGWTDFPTDTGCTSADDRHERESGGDACDDFLDNDTDGNTDYPADGGCTDAGDTDETGGVAESPTTTIVAGLGIEDTVREGPVCMFRFNLRDAVDSTLFVDGDQDIEDTLESRNLECEMTLDVASTDTTTHGFVPRQQKTWNTGYCHRGHIPLEVPWGSGSVTGTMTLTVTAPDGTKTGTQSVTCTDGALVYTNPACLSDVGDFTDCPAGATQRTTTDDLDVELAAAKSAGHDFFFLDDHDWFSSTTYSFAADFEGVRGYGAQWAEGGTAQIQHVAGGSSFPIFDTRKDGISVTRLQVLNSNATMGGSQQTNSVINFTQNGSEAADNGVVADVHAVGVGHFSNCTNEFGVKGQSNTYLRVSMRDPVISGTGDISGNVGFFSSCDKTSVMDIDCSKDGGSNQSLGEHCGRYQGDEGLIISDSRYANAPGPNGLAGRGNLLVRGNGYNSPACGQNPVVGTVIFNNDLCDSTDAQNASYCLQHGPTNRTSVGHDASCPAGPIGAQAENVSHSLIVGNDFTLGDDAGFTGVAIPLHIAGPWFTLRDNLFRCETAVCSQNSDEYVSVFRRDTPTNTFRTPLVPIEQYDIGNNDFELTGGATERAFQLDDCYAITTGSTSTKTGPDLNNSVLDNNTYDTSQGSGGTFTANDLSNCATETNPVTIP